VVVAAALAVVVVVVVESLFHISVLLKAENNIGNYND